MTTTTLVLLLLLLLDDDVQRMFVFLALSAVQHKMLNKNISFKLLWTL